MKPEIPPLHSQRLKLRYLEEGDLDDTLRWRNRPEVRCQFFYDQVISEESHREWFGGYLAKRDDLIFMCEEIETGNRIAQTALYNIDIERNRAEFGRFLLSDREQGSKGWGTEAMALTCELGFGHLGFDHIDLEVKQENKPAIHIYQKLGFLMTEDCGEFVKMGLDADQWNSHESIVSD